MENNQHHPSKKYGESDSYLLINVIKSRGIQYCQQCLGHKTLFQNRGIQQIQIFIWGIR